VTKTYYCPHCDYPQAFEYTPARPAPFCLDHDNPKFSDPGSAAVLEGPEECLNCDRPINPDSVLNQ
jgi:hypothetical protein